MACREHIGWDRLLVKDCGRVGKRSLNGMASPGWNDSALRAVAARSAPDDVRSPELVPVVRAGPPVEICGTDLGARGPVTTRSPHDDRIAPSASGAPMTA
jgi:hypothetical protein